MEVINTATKKDVSGLYLKLMNKEITNAEFEELAEIPEMEIKITINGTERTYTGDYDELHTTDWNEIIRDLLDIEKSYESQSEKA